MSEGKASFAGELVVSQWFNTPGPITLASLRGRPAYLHAFQLLCPGCLSVALPQVERIEKVFARSDLAIIGLHTVFELHDQMTPEILEGFLREKAIRYPVGVDHPGERADLPLTMLEYRLRGTPSSVLIGRDGTIRHQVFGVEDDMTAGARIALAIASS